MLSESFITRLAANYRAKNDELESANGKLESNLQCNNKEIDALNTNAKTEKVDIETDHEEPLYGIYVGRE